MISPNKNPRLIKLLYIISWLIKIFKISYLGAYGAHVLSVDPDNAKLRATFDTANKYHLVHSVALLAVPLARVPR